MSIAVHLKVLDLEARNSSVEVNLDSNQKSCAWITIQLQQTLGQNIATDLGKWKYYFPSEATEITRVSETLFTEAINLQNCDTPILVKVYPQVANDVRPSNAVVTRKLRKYITVASSQERRVVYDTPYKS